MRRVAVGAIAVALFAAPAFALTVSDVDTNGDSFVSFEELTVKFPELSTELFSDIDTSDDDLVDEVELAAAIEAELIKEPAE